MICWNLKRHLEPFNYGGVGSNDNHLFDNKRVWEFRYKMQYEEPRVKVIQQDPLIMSWLLAGQHREYLF